VVVSPTSVIQESCPNLKYIAEDEADQSSSESYPQN